MTLSSLRARWVTLIGTFVALGLGVALIATMGLALASTVDAPSQRPTRLAGAPVLVRGADDLHVTTHIGVRTQPLAQPHAVPADVAATLSEAAPTVADRSFPAVVSVLPSSAPGPSPSPTASHPGPVPGVSGALPAPGPAGALPVPGSSELPPLPSTAKPLAVPDPSGSPPTPGTARSLAVPNPSGSPPTPGTAKPLAAPNPSGSPPTPGTARPSPTPSSSGALPPLAASNALSEGETVSLVGHPWAVAGFGGHRLVAGRPPHAAAEIVLAADPALVGRTVRVRTPAGVGDFTLAGVLAPVTFERAAFFTDRTAAAIAPRIDNLAVDASPESVRAIVSGFPGVQVLTGDARRRADPDPDRDSDALVAMNALLGTAGGVTTFVSVFVVASTFAFAVAQRRREIGLLRMAGATPGQIRRTVFAEAAIVGAVASAAGCVLGAEGAPWLARLLVDERLAPAWFAIGDHRWPYHVAFWTGLVVALAGVVVATVRAGRVRPTEALREASVDSRVMTAGRWIAGVAILAAGLGLLGWRLLGDPGEALHRKTYTTQPMLLITAVALLAPVLAGPLARLVAWLPARLPGATGLLMRASATAAIRRTAAVAAPVLITVALAGSLLGTTATIAEAQATEQRDQTAADLIVTGGALEAAALDSPMVTAIRAVPGARVMTSASTAVYTLEDGVALVRSQAQAVDPSALTAVRRLPVVAGEVGDLDDGGIIVNEEWAEHTVGDRVDVWLGDGTPRTLRIVAVLATGTGGNGVYVTSRNAGGAPPDQLELSWAPGADKRSGEAAVRRLLHSPAVTPEPASRPDIDPTAGGQAATSEPASRPGVDPAAGGPATTSEPATRPDIDATAGGPSATTSEPPSHPGVDLTAGDPGAPGGVRVQTREQWLADQLPVGSRQTRVGFMVVLGIALLYTGIAIANTMVMATSDRTRELAVLRLTGATRPQVLRLVAAEALTVVVVGAVLGLFVTGLNLLGIWAALAVLSVWAPIVAPWSVVAATVAACAIVAVPAAVLPTVAALRTRPMELAGARE
ncbi:FtsX-like permease family protein [Actinoplanes sp. NPDC026670]|uniref:FtsX-like permease family protein n=1 Tax=Actinoplanes sp. NPDC026670 TaxID=3154700 RepID=UPI00340AD5CF